MNSNLSKATKKFTIKKPYFFNIKTLIKNHDKEYEYFTADASTAHYPQSIKKIFFSKFFFHLKLTRKSVPAASASPSVEIVCRTLPRLSCRR